LLYPLIQVKPIKGDALLTNGNLGKVGADFGSEAIAIHAKIKGGVSQSNQSWQNLGTVGNKFIHPRTSLLKRGYGETKNQ
jgi:hypothetical protein